MSSLYKINKCPLCGISFSSDIEEYCPSCSRAIIINNKINSVSYDEYDIKKIKKRIEEALNTTQEYEIMTKEKEMKKVMWREPKEYSKSNRFAGKDFCFTGFRNKGWEEIITANGGWITNGVSRNTDYLICKDLESQSSKMRKAKEYGIKIMSWIQFQVFMDVNSDSSFLETITDKYGDKYSSIGTVANPRNGYEGRSVIKKETEKKEFEEPKIKTRKLNLDED